MSYTYFFGKFMSYTYIFGKFMSYTYGFWVIYVLYLSRATPLMMICVIIWLKTRNVHGSGSIYKWKSHQNYNYI